MVRSMEYPKGLYLQNIPTPEFEGGELAGHSIWIPDGIIQVNRNSTEQTVDPEPNYVALYGCSTEWTNEKFWEEVDRNNLHFYFEFCYQ